MFLIVSGNRENMEYAIENQVWQTRRKFKVKKNEVVFIKVSGANTSEYLGIVTTKKYESILDWPGDWNSNGQSKAHTIRFRPITEQDFAKGQTPIRYGKVKIK